MKIFVNFKNKKTPISIGTKIIILDTNVGTGGVYKCKVHEIYKSGIFKVRYDNYPSIKRLFNNTCQSMHDKRIFIDHIGKLKKRRTELKRTLFKKESFLKNEDQTRIAGDIPYTKNKKTSC